MTSDVSTGPSALMEMLCGKWTTQLLALAAELKIADALEDSPRSASEVAERTQTDAAVMYRLLRAMATLGVLEQVEGKRFRLTALGQPLRSNAPGSLRAMAIMLGRPWHNRIWEALGDCARTGVPFGARHALGTTIWEYFDANEHEAKLFNAAMTGRSMVTNVMAVEAYDFSRIRTLIDVGGGHGRMLGMILRQYPSMRGVLFDQPSLADGARTELAAIGVLDRCEFVGGNFLESVPKGADACIMSHILHDWADREASIILRNCRAALPTGAKLIVVDAVLKPDGHRDWAKLLDLEMMISYGGRERTAEELADLFRSSGFRLERVISTRALDCVTEAIAV